MLAALALDDIDDASTLHEIVMRSCQCWQDFALHSAQRCCGHAAVMGSACMSAIAFSQRGTSSSTQTWWIRAPIYCK